MKKSRKTLFIDLGHFRASGSPDVEHSWHNHGLGLTATICREQGLPVDYVSLKELNDWGELRGKIKDYDFFGLSMMSSDYPQAMKAIDLIKEVRPESKIIIGGIHVTVAPDELRDNQKIDYLFFGESEITFPEFLKNPSSFKREIKGEPVLDLDSLPFLDRHLYLQPLEQNVKVWGDSPMATFLTARGCPFNCAFCLDGDTLVMMADFNWKMLKNIKVGDKIIGLRKENYGHSIVKTVIQRKFHRRAKTFRMITNKGEVITTAEHPWLSYANHSRWRKTANLKPGDKIHWVCEPNQAQETDDYKKGYLAGATVGDGCIGHYKRTDKKWNRNTLTNHFKLVGDYEMLDTFQKYADDLNINVHECFFNGGKIYKNVNRAIGGFSEKTVKTIENLIATDGNKEFQRGFLAGFFDADGSNAKCKKTTIIRFHGIDKKVLTRVALYLENAGFSVVWGKKSLRLRGNAAIRNSFISWIQPKIAKKRRLRFGNSPAIILKIEELLEQEVFNIATGTENFIANGLASHNCQPAERNHFGIKVRRRSVKNVITEVKEVVKKYNPVFLIFHDDHFMFDKDWLEEFVKEYASIRLPFWAASRADFICNNQLTIYQLRGVGLEVVSIGFESGSQRVLDYIRKGTTVEQNYRSAEIVGKLGAKIYANIMYGFPGETRGEQMATRKMCLYLSRVAQTMISPAYFTPYPGSDLGNECIKNSLSLIDRNNYNRYGRDKIKGVDYDFLDKLVKGEYDSLLG